jgi:uncharacterized repeat protein (TIGR01451 family)
MTALKGDSDLDKLKWLCILLLGCLLILRSVVPIGAGYDLQAGTTYYVSSSGGNDDNDGLSEGAPFKTVAKVNTLDLQPGNQVLFKCGDIWQAEQLVIAASGTEADPIVFGSYPEGCTDKPVLSGSLPITGWTVHAGDIYRADLPAGEFPLGINQLFRNGRRLTLGRWPNLDAGNGGYSFVDGHTAGGNQITDNELPSGVNWAGAIVHIKNIRWSMIDRQVSSSSGKTLVLNAGLSCLISSWTTCDGWGYFLNNHLDTLDQDGEWYYDASARRVYLYSADGVPSDIEGSVILEEAETLRHGGIMLGSSSPIAHVAVENVEISRWFNHGIGTPGSMRGDIYHHVTIRDCTIKDVDAAGVRLSTWIWSADNGRDGLRGGHHMVFSNNVIEGANHFGVTGYFAESTFEDNEIKNVALIENLGKSGMGCGITRDECTENGDGFRIRTYDVLDSGYGNTLRYNRFEKIGYNGIDVFGPGTTLEKNLITQSCYSKADCGGVRTFGSGDLSTTQVYDISIVNNIIVDIPGNVDGCHASRPAFGMGLYIDHYSRDVEVRNNTVISTTITGILYQRSTGQIVENTVYNASLGAAYSGHISLTGSETRATMSGNVMYGLTTNAWTLYSYDLANSLASDDNYFFHPYVDEHIAYGSSWTRYTFSGWQVYSGLETHSKTNWFTLGAGEPPLSRILYNDTAQIAEIDLGTAQYLDLDQNGWVGSISLQPYTSQILIYDGEAAPDLSPSSKTASVTAPTTGDLVTYTITVHNLSGPMTYTVAMTDVVPSGLDYVSGTLRASSGTWDDALAPTLTWTGVLTPTPVITITYAAAVTRTIPGTGTIILPQVISNTAIIAVPGYEPIFRTATVIANPYQIYLPSCLNSSALRASQRTENREQQFPS